ncbi:MAG TPA: KR domain-containing protein, partial [Thermoanaerobaculia bacterium]|nr:KR domain-containing protein [Thermoanaerobaculia bacterium]
DLADPRSVAAAVAEAGRRFGALHGVVHTAGTYGERTFRVLAETGREELAWHLRRVRALFALEQALAARLAGAADLDFVVLVGSLATAVGGLAYGAYTAANLALAAFAEERRRAGSALPWIALDWDVWRFESESDEITRARADLAALAMSPREGEDAFRRAVAAAPTADRLLVSTEDLAARRAQRRERIAGRAGSAASRAGAERHPRPALATPFVAPESDLERRIAGVWQELLGFDRVGADDNFFELGGDSFVAVCTASRLKDELDVELPVARLYEALTVRALARLVDEAGAADEQRVVRLEELREAKSRRRDVIARRRERTGVGSGAR